MTIRWGVRYTRRPPPRPASNQAGLVVQGHLGALESKSLDCVRSVAKDASKTSGAGSTPVAVSLPGTGS